MDKPSISNLYELNGRVPVAKAIPFGVQHILAMFVANLAPITIVAGACGLSGSELSMLLQNAMFVAGIATLVQLYPVWRIGAKLPIVMGVSFTFVTLLCYVGVNYGYPTVIGAILVGGFLEGILGLSAKYWRRFVTPIVSSTVVTAIGFSLLPVGTRSFGGGYGEGFGSAQNLILGTVTLLSCLIFNIFAKSYKKQLSILFGLVTGYILACFMGVVDITSILKDGFIAFPKFIPYTPEFHAGAIVAVFLIYLVSAAETIGDSTAVVYSGLGRDIEEHEIRGAIACDGFASTLSGLFGCMPVTSFSQNVGLVAMTHVVNRFTIATGAVCMILAGLFPPVANFFASIPEAVLGGCTIMMFGSIMVSGIQMIPRAGLNQKNITIVALSLAVGLGFTSATEANIWRIFPQMVKDIFGGNCVAVVFVVAIILSILLPEKMDIEKEA